MRGSLSAALSVAAIALGLAALVAGPAATAEAAREGTHAVTLLQIDGAIGPATARYFVRGLEAAEASGSALVILQLDTPGGLDTAMRDIIRAILASTIPVVTYVAPSGARAASAGTYILYASHFAAMAPATNLGAATPISIGGEPSTPPTPAPAPAPASPDGDKKQKTPEEISPGSAHERKAVNDAVAYIRSLAQLR